MSLVSLNGIEFIGSHIKFKVQGFKEKIDGHTYFQIQVTFTMTEPFKIQDLSYTYQHCQVFSEALSAQCPDMPSLPTPSIFVFKPAAQEVERRRIDLEKWLKAIVWRCDVIGTVQFQEFCNINNLTERKWLDPPQPSVELKEGHAFGVVDFYYDPNTQVCFVATSDESLISKIQGYVSVLSRGLINTEAPIKSQIICYRLDVDQDGEPKTRQLWKNNYLDKITTITWDEKLTILAIGFETGSILVLRVSPESEYKEQSELCQFIKHTDAVSGLATNCIEGQLYSISKDRCLITTDLTCHNRILKEKEFPNELTCMLQQKEFKRLFVGDTGGSVYIFHYEDGSLKAAHQIKPNIKMCITSLQFHAIKDFLIIGSKEGLVIVFDLGKPGREKMSTLISQIQTVRNQKSVLFSLSSKELYINYNNNVLIVDSTRVKVLYSLGAHRDVVTKLEMFEDLGLLITAGKDGIVKFWQYKYFPHTQINLDLAQFRGELMPLDLNLKVEEEKNNQQKQQRQIKPELDDLDGWSKD